MSTQSAGASEGQSVTVRYGPYNHKLNYAGLTVAQARAKLQAIWGVPADAKGLKGKEQLADDHVIQAGEEIEFIKRQGEKG